MTRERRQPIEYKPIYNVRFEPSTHSLLDRFNLEVFNPKKVGRHNPRRETRVAHPFSSRDLARMGEPRGCEVALWMPDPRLTRDIFAEHADRLRQDVALRPDDFPYSTLKHISPARDSADILEKMNASMLTLNAHELILMVELLTRSNNDGEVPKWAQQPILIGTPLQERKVMYVEPMSRSWVMEPFCDGQQAEHAWAIMPDRRRAFPVAPAQSD